ncbi:calcium dependent mitochondrial carrier protein [Marssonina coronariae]|uniref:Mitochondrial thiamine pyrophosphate carrier 1 n=1 Tax=Diplocarpon coronariae TaxID=2795749 RepID=A0A218Z441_9HELO|nr:calcium dependent mitochondrial carrier protein [Marssonina coronariae]
MDRELLETQNSRDARIEKLWRKLDPQHKGELDLNGLKKGLNRIDHPLKNANDMLKDVIRAMDKDGDKVIQYEEFRTFIERTEKELRKLFHSIDRDQDGRLDKGELRNAFRKAGLSVPNSKLDQFFSEVDENHDGYITFDEWRNFLLFLPINTNPGLKAVMSYYSSAVTINSEGDTSISEETLEGLGMERPSRFSFLSILFGAIIRIAEPPRTSRSDAFPPRSASEPPREATVPAPSLAQTNQTAIADNAQAAETIPTLLLCTVEEESSLSEDFEPAKKILLTDILPDPGYFAAGAVAGVVSRTTTAPLDRLKVYLIANIGPARNSIDAVKKGDAVGVAKTVGRPLIDAIKELWKAGGMRSLFAGNGLNVIKVMPESAIKFGSYEFAKRVLAHMEGHDDPKHINPYSKFAAGGVGGLISQLFVYPIDTLKFRMQCETVSGGLHGNALIIATAKKMYKQGAIKSSYRGLTMGLLGMFPYSAIDLGTFEYLKGRLAQHNARMLGCHEEDALPGSFATGCIGAFSGAFGASIVYPINLLRTRLQAQGTILHPATYTGIVDVTRKTVQKEGVKGLFKGITPNLLKVVPAVSITYVVYENGKKALHLK